MPDAWKIFEAESAALFGVHRAWANSGHRLDFPRPDELDDAPAIGQCKQVQRMSLEELTALAEEMEALGLQSEKLGVVCIKVRRGKGKKSAPLVVMTFPMWDWFCKHPTTLVEVGVRRRIAIETVKPERSKSDETPA